MSDPQVYVVHCNVLTPYGLGVGPCCEGLLAGKTAVSKIDRFSTESFISGNGATVPQLRPKEGTSLAMQMLSMLLNEESLAAVPSDAMLILATTTGEIDFLEEDVLMHREASDESSPKRLLEKVEKLTRMEAPGIVVSSACASASVAVSLGSSMIRSGERDCVLVVACDALSEFVFSGFSSLMALDPVVARPFDRNRAGLSLGEGAAFALLMEEGRASREGRDPIGKVAGWGMTSDANHITGPSKDGSGLASAIRKSLETAGVSADQIGCISAHGTGTVYNDSMEMKAFKVSLGDVPIPTYSIKGGTGHTMGAAGLLEALLALHFLSCEEAPPTAGLVEPDEEALGWVSTKPQAVKSPMALLTNAGFGGVNCALVLTRGEERG